MPSNHPLPFRIGIIGIAFCAILNAQPGTISKWGVKSLPPHKHAATCANCVRDLNGQIQSNPAPVRAFLAKHPCPVTGSAKGGCAGYVVSRIKPLKPGARDTPQNMRWRTIAQAIKEHPK
jgi:hypothetical protein